MFGLGKRPTTPGPYASTRDQERAARRQARDEQAAASRRAGHRARVLRDGDTAGQSSRRRWFGGAR
ncbi:hypothetical protein [Streptomyces sp. NPDC007264]|uniref:hypothetical protein n=1 Tax=Streptomyces sp. NPDC007264 TaxID=3364777 RepID=UPI0036DE418F